MTNFGKAIAYAWAIAFARWPMFKMVSFLEYLCFLEGFFSQTNYNVVVESLFSCFLHFYFLTQNDQFCKGYSLCYGLWKMAVFLKWSNFSKIWCFLERFFAQTN